MGMKAAELKRTSAVLKLIKHGPSAIIQTRMCIIMSMTSIQRSRSNDLRGVHVIVRVGRQHESQQL